MQLWPDLPVKSPRRIAAVTAPAEALSSCRAATESVFLLNTGRMAHWVLAWEASLILRALKLSLVMTGSWLNASCQVYDDSPVN